MAHGTSLTRSLKVYGFFILVSGIQHIFYIFTPCVAEGEEFTSKTKQIYKEPSTYFSADSNFYIDDQRFESSKEEFDEHGNHKVLPDDEEEGEEEEMQEDPALEITWGRPNKHSIYFDDTTPTNVTAVVGQRAVLPCTVVNIGRKDVTWIRKRDIHILTVGIFTYTSDDRFKVSHPKSSDDWNLEISPVAFRDAGVYECQVSTSPKISLPVLLGVEVQQAKIPGPNELFIRNGSTISLTCIVNTHSENVGIVTWFRDGKKLDYDSPRGGVSLEVEKTPEKTTSKLYITRAIKIDSGNYTCAPQRADAASVIVHVVSGEESAAVQTGSSPRTVGSPTTMILSFIFGISFTFFFQSLTTRLQISVWQR